MLFSPYIFNTFYTDLCYDWNVGDYFVLSDRVAFTPEDQSLDWDNKTVEGINIMLAMDVSTSMLAEDLKPNRMEAAKDVAHEFISGRPNDNIGLTIFAGERTSLSSI